MENLQGLDSKIKEIAGRIKELREIMGLSISDMAKKTAVSEEEYLACENGQSDLHFAFIYRCANAFNVDVTDIIEGYSPRLKSYTVTRRGEGQRIEKAHGMTYYNLASAFKNRIAEPLYVKSVIVFGRITVIDDPAKIADITTRLSHKFIEDDEYIKAEIEKYGPATLLLELIPEHICGKLVEES